MFCFFFVGGVRVCVCVGEGGLAPATDIMLDLDFYYYHISSKLSFSSFHEYVAIINVYRSVE